MDDTAPDLTGRTKSSTMPSVSSTCFFVLSCSRTALACKLSRASVRQCKERRVRLRCMPELIVLLEARAARASQSAHRLLWRSQRLSPTPLPERLASQCGHASGVVACGKGNSKPVYELVHNFEPQQRPDDVAHALGVMSADGSLACQHGHTQRKVSLLSGS